MQGISKNYVYLIIINTLTTNVACTRWWCWLRLCTTSRMVAWSVPDGVIGIFSLTFFFRPHYYLWVDPDPLGWPSPFGLTQLLWVDPAPLGWPRTFELTQPLWVDPAPLTELSTKCLSWGIKATGTMGWQPCQLMCLLCRNVWNLNILETSGPTQLASFTNATPSNTTFNPLDLELDIYSLAHHLCTMWIFYEPRRVTLGNTRYFVEE